MNSALMSGHGILAMRLVVPLTTAETPEKASETMVVMFANAMNPSAKTPRNAPPSGIIQTVGSSEPRASAENAPTTAATTEAKNMPIMFGQNAALGVSVMRDRLPN